MKTIFASTSLLLLATSAFAAFPSVGPDFQRPAVEAPSAFRDAELGAWKIAESSSPASTATVHVAWWSSYGDAALAELVARALENNQDLRAAAARVDQARAAAGLTRAAYLPSLQIDALASRGRSLDTNYRDSDYANVPLTLNYELDLWGRMRRANESARADAAAQAALFASARLAIAADTAQTYFALRASEQEESIVAATVATRREARDVIAARLRSGSAGDLDVARAETELATTEADLAAVQQRRAALQNALAVLVGAPAPAFVLSTLNPLPSAATGTSSAPRSGSPEAVTLSTSSATPPTIPSGLPASLLERRPDIVAAERTLAAANARIGVAKAAFFPAIQLTGAAGYESADFSDVFHWDQRVWNIGPRLYLPIFQGGRNRANLARAEAIYDETVATYRQRVLIAFREVQDALTATRLLTVQADAQSRAAAGARRAAQLSRVRYDAGFVGYLEVVDSERSALAAERAVVQLGALRLFNSVTLIKALGGGWTSRDATFAAR